MSVGKTAIFAGSFDIFTNGHLDIVHRAIACFDKVIVLVSCPPKKKTLFTVSERVGMLETLFSDEERVEVDSCSGLVSDYAKENSIKILIRGVRPSGDFGAEFNLASINRKLWDEIDTVFFPASEENHYISSSMVKEVLSYKSDISEFVPKSIYKLLTEYNKR